MKPRLFATIKTRTALTHPEVPAGTIGVIVAIFNKPDEAFEVEFADGDGKTVAQAVLKLEDFYVVTELEP